MTTTTHTDPFERARARRSVQERDAERDVLQFVTLVSPEFVEPRPLAQIARAYDDALAGPVYALIEAPPRHGKTELAMHAQARRLKYQPGQRIAYASYSSTFAKRKSRRVRQLAARAGLMLTDERRRGDDWDQARSTTHWETNNGGSYIAGGRGGGFVGEGFNEIHIDDPFAGREEAESVAVRESVWETFAGTLVPRLEPGGSLFVSHQRWNDDDLIARIAAAAANDPALAFPWRRITLPAIDDQGRPLWPDRYDVQALARIRATVGEFNWWSQFQQRPRPRGGRVFAEPARYESPFSWSGLPARFPVIGVDPASSERKGADQTAIVVQAFWVDAATRLLHSAVLDVWQFRRELPEVTAFLLQVQRAYTGAPIALEVQGGEGRAIAQQLRRIQPELNLHEVRTTTDKHTRAQTTAAMWNGRRLTVPARDLSRRQWLKPYLEEVQRFTGIADRRDDAVDATVHGVNFAHQSLGLLNSGGSIPTSGGLSTFSKAPF